jgi:citrate lyase subunit beta/citryl-CoA lyase
MSASKTRYNDEHIKETSAVLNNQDKLVRRSTLIVPAHVDRFVNRAATARADAVMLDLEDGVAPGQKDLARSCLKAAAEKIRAHVNTIIIRVNNDSFEQLVKDLDIAIKARPDAIFVPKLETLEEVVRCDAVLSSLEHLSGIKIGSIELPLSLETPRALLEFKAICERRIARIKTVAFGSEDIALELGIKATEEGIERLVGNSLTVMAAAAFQLQPLGLLGDLTNFKDTTTLECAARRSFSFGFMGSYCIHPNQVAILNKTFSPSQEDEQFAREVLRIAASREGQAGHVDGTMIAASAYRRAERLIRRIEIIQEYEARIRRSG